MGSRAANLALTGRPTPFTAMSPAARERYLLSWGDSRLALRRSAFHGLRRLLTFLAYADPGLDVPNPQHERIGYVPDDPPVTSHLAAIEPVALPPGAAPVTFEADAVIVGSGAAGGVVAAALAEAGRSVVVLEAGPFVDEAAMPRDELAAFDRLYLNHGLVTTWDGSVTLLAGAALGGGTTINWMTAIPAPESVRAEWLTDHGLEGVTGPIWEDDVRAIEAELRVAVSTHIPPKDANVLRGARALGWEAAPNRRNATECGDCGSCQFGCRRGTKRSGLRIHLARAVDAGARIVPDARVTRVIMDGGRATAVEALLGEGVTSRALSVRAKSVVLAAGALRSPSVLEATGLDHPAIGRYLRVHPVPVIAGRFSETIDMWRGTMQAARSLQFVEPDSDRNGYVMEAAPGHPGLLALALPWEGTEAHAQVMGGARYLSPIIAVTRDGGEGRTNLTRAGGVRIDYRLDATGVATLRHALVSMAAIMRAAGAVEQVAAGAPPVWLRAGFDDSRFAGFSESLRTFDFTPNRGTVFSAHQMGTIRMGADPRTHACDPWGRVRAAARGDAIVPGLYVADGSVFPTGIGVNPMVTIMALARRTSRTVLAEG